MKKIILLISSICIITNSNAQSLLTTAEVSGDTLFTSGNHYKSAVAFNPIKNLYYSNNAGGSDAEEVFTISGGTSVSNNSVLDYRGFWWNPETSRIEGNAWNNYYVYDYLTADGYLGGTIGSSFSTTPPNAQSVGAYDSINHIIYYYSNGAVYGESSINGVDIPTINLLNNTGGSFDFTNIQEYSLIYTGIATKEIGLYNRVDKKIVFFNLANGRHSETVNMPNNTFDQTLTYFQFSYANSLVWLYDGINYRWIGYKIQCTVDIPDANFKNYLVSNTAINTNHDLEIQCFEAANYTGGIWIPNQGITDLTGIEAFTSLSTLNCNDNSITTLDLSANPELTSINCRNNLISNLTLPSLPNLTFLDAYNNQISLIDLTHFPLLSIFDISNNQITSLDVSQNPDLIYLIFDHNQINTIDVTHNTKLINIHAHFTNISSIDVSQNTVLSRLYAHYTNLTTVDVSTCTQLHELLVNNAQLTSLNIKNGNNTAISPYNFSAASNPNLTCIQVDSAEWSTANWLYKDNTATFSENCINSLEENEILNTFIYPNPAANVLTLNSIDDSEIQILNTLGKVVYETVLSSSKTINIEHLEPGIYTLKTANNLVKFIKK
jgi:hypothetical protein